MSRTTIPPEPGTVAADLTELIRLGQAMRAETNHIQDQQDEFWRACRARAAARVVAGHLVAVRQ
jgi:hypothetical protein